MTSIIPTRDGLAGVVEDGIEINGRLYALYAWGLPTDNFESTDPAVSTVFPASGELVCVVPGCDVVYDVPCEINTYYVPRGERC